MSYSFPKGKSTRGHIESRVSINGRPTAVEEMSRIGLGDRHGDWKRPQQRLSGYSTAGD